MEGGARLCQAANRPRTGHNGAGAATPCTQVLAFSGAISAAGAGFWAKNWQTEQSWSSAACEAATPGRKAR